MGPYSYIIYIYGIYLGLEVVPMSLLLGLYLYYIGTWTHWHNQLELAEAVIPRGSRYLIKRVLGSLYRAP